MCSDGSAYRIYGWRGESDHLLIHFAGGGAAWDGDTAAQPLTISDFSGWYIPAISDLLRLILGGIFQHSNPDNPFYDWNVIYIPYCTADFDIGASIQQYVSSEGKTTTIHHAGRQNVTEALAWVFAAFDQPEKVVVSGESAGGFASVFWSPTVAAHYADSVVYQIADGIYLETPLWNEIIETTWGADMLANFGFTPGDDLVANTYLHYSEDPAPNLTYLHINTLYDETLIRFEARLNGQINDEAYRDDWSRRMLAAMKRIDDSDLPYFYYLTDYGLNVETGKTPHTSLSFPLFYQIEEDGVRLSEWLRRIVIEGETFSVGSGFLP